MRHHEKKMGRSILRLWEIAKLGDKAAKRQKNYSTGTRSTRNIIKILQNFACQNTTPPRFRTNILQPGQWSFKR